MTKRTKSPRKATPTTKQQNVRFPEWMRVRAKEAAKWEGLTFSAYLRSALLERIRKTETSMGKPAKEE